MLSISPLLTRGLVHVTPAPNNHNDALPGADLQSKIQNPLSAFDESIDRTDDFVDHLAVSWKVVCTGGEQDEMSAANS